MQLNMLKCKLHQACVTDTELDYEGSCAIDANLMDAAGIREFEQIHVYNLANGARFTTYAIRGEAGSRMISMNGAAAHLCSEGDRIIICCYANVDESELDRHEPALVYCDGDNRITHQRNGIPLQVA
ncbi:aspartate 1-decarboxylase [Alkalilimnicola ehrlichii MLHE-1]|uniref:Aspartate 1-decarboxylase n=1 Tax=Alkalilimnicola ehrlichii (strain ATCC BAA-1101 / DSM 17681 / MLHE-1) TaxID=187272 RepID=PAND_ALKEH|nr:aspartate 1-decarboxylase [Alkalilimnicola ehrlichii]Q0AB67.1 RecName: Full=Aspartate 1-decarboxylase; AltName: Full=Aspartate alpha-decarboxylase; Contains: RecName: Full=Aspartate 1-decarboxylase beta chain; Contains: RecName: Full=Aspartate 1-decarboxylase alpha chain; Flags: Precursor [Alkalilimnicola ehrlichii MLHE-1]ABI55920.1 aspartate 1-decarboxylase [Alkalilimnicola ehrlichii MLHE-1]